MGEVYRARDTRLDRIVAIKIVPDSLANRPELQARFKREANAIAGLNHPHICTLYDIGQDEGTNFLVMEYLKGETLADRLTKGPLPLDQALRYAIEMTEALDETHRQGITHRDLKPANIMLTESGVKLLDFGLAKIGEERPSILGRPRTSGPVTLATRTMEGTILGTLQYMAPEQLEGRDADARTDIFAFGAVLYEMVTGVRAFQGETHASLIASILERTSPQVSSLQPLSSAALDRLIATCLAKDPNERWQSIRDVGRQLKWISEPADPLGAVAVAQHGWKRQRILTGAAILFFMTSAALAIPYFFSSPDIADEVRYSIDWTSTSPELTVPMLSPDGRQLAFVALDNQGWQLIWIRSLGSMTARPLRGTEGASSLFWSPDSRFVAFFVEGKLKRIDASGGPALTLCDAPSNLGGAWSSRGTIIFGSNTGLKSVSENGGEVRVLTTLDTSRSETAHAWPEFLPDGERFLFLAGSSLPENSTIAAGSLDASPPQRVMAGFSAAAYSTGSIFFLRDAALVAQRFDPDNLQLSGEPALVAEKVANNAVNGRAAFSVSDNGTVAYVNGRQPERRLTWFDRKGNELGVVGSPEDYRQVNLSPDERRIVTERFDLKTGVPELWILEPERDLATRFTIGTQDRDPIWSPDGGSIIFSSRRNSNAADIYTKDVSGPSTEETVLLDLEQLVTVSDWSKDGRFILYKFGTSPGDLYALPLSGDRTPIALTNTPRFNEDEGRFSPDGRWVAYNGNDTGRMEVYAVPFPNADDRIQISNQGGVQPRWRADGRELFYLSPDGTMMSVDLPAGPSLSPGIPRPLFRTRLLVDASIDQYTVTSDGQRFLMPVHIDQSPTPISLILNWRPRS
jgi:Tol biopolymer transport system component